MAGHAPTQVDAPVTLEEMLAARDTRVARQQELLAQHACTLVSYGLNIPGPHKTSPAFAWAFEQERCRIEAAVAENGWTALHRQATYERTGYEGLLAMQADPLDVKRTLVAVEEGTPLGRLFDIDVLRTDGHKVSRTELGLPGRACLLCDQPAFVCARSRAHSIEELLAAIEAIVAEAQKSQAAPQHQDRTAFESRLSAALRFALVEELDATPKPGLVDRHDNGAHADMDHALFMRSIDAVVPHIARMGMAGYDWQGELPGLFPHIQRIGLEAEAAMFAATGGVNTHKGAVFTLGILAASVGYLEGRYHAALRQPATAPAAIGEPTPNDPNPQSMQDAPTPRKTAPTALSPALISQAAATLAAPAMQAQFAAMDAKRQLLETGADVSLTHGERIWCELGIGGIRQEAALGFPCVFETALPRLAGADLRDAEAFNAAKLAALLAVMERLDDSNVISRASLEGLAWTKRRAREALAHGYDADQLARFNAQCVARNISPGGAADLLEAALFVYALQRPHL